VNLPSHGQHVHHGWPIDYSRTTFRATLGARAEAGRTGVQARHFDVLLDAAGGFFEGEFEIVAQVRAALGFITRRRGPAGPPAEEHIEDVLERAEASAAKVLAQRLRRPKPIVVRAALGITEHLVGLVDLLEAFRLGIVLLDIRMVLAGEPPEGALDLLRRCAAPDSQDLIVVAHAGG